MHVRTALRAAASAGALAAIAVPGLAQAATGSTYDHVDARHDVQHYHSADQSITAAPHEKAADIVRTKIAYEHTALVSRVWLRSQTIPANWFAVGQLRTDSSAYQWFASGGPSGMQVQLEQGSTTVSCQGIAVHASAKTGRVTVTVPRSCLGKPQWVRAGEGFAVTATNNDEYADDGLQKAGLGSTGGLTLSPRLHRG